MRDPVPGLPHGGDAEAYARPRRGSAPQPERDDDAVESVPGDQGEAALQRHALVADQPAGLSRRRPRAEHPDPAVAEHEGVGEGERLVAALEIPRPQRRHGHREVAGVPEAARVAQLRLAVEPPEEKNPVTRPRVLRDVAGRPAVVVAAAAPGAPGSIPGSSMAGDQVTLTQVPGRPGCGYPTVRRLAAGPCAGVPALFS